MVARCGFWLLAYFAAVSLSATPDSDAPLHDVIDYYIKAPLQEAGIDPAPVADDATLVRRLTLDLAGRIPAAVGAQGFVQSTAPDKKAQLIDRLMQSEEFVQYLATRIDWFLTAGDGNVEDYLRAAIAEKRGWDQVFADVVLADLRPDAEAALPFLKNRANDTDRLTNDVSVAFFGVNISCAKCHDHFLAPDWTQGHYYGMKSFFARTFRNGDFVAERSFGKVKFTTTSGKEHQAQPMFLTSSIVELEPDEPTEEERKEANKVFEECKKKKEAPPRPERSLREALVDVALSDGENHFFARAIVNRVWHHYMGTGLVMPLDQMHSENPASHPELLDRLAEDLIAHDYDLRRLIRAVVMSSAYARSSEWQGEDRPYDDSFAVAMSRPLTPTQLARSLSLAVANPTSLSELEGDVLSARIRELAAPRNKGLFEQPKEDFQISAKESLWFTNSDQFASEYLQGGLIQHLIQLKDTNERIRVATWNILSRPASDEEIDLLREYVANRVERQDDACRQIVWALLTSSEFRFNH